MSYQPIGILATCPQVMASVALMHAAMDDTGDYASVNFAIRDSLTDDQVDALAAESELAASAEELEDVRHDLRTTWADAIARQHALSTPKVPTVEGGKIVMVPITVLVGSLMDMQWSVDLLTDALRTGDLTKLHLHLRDSYIEGNADQLATIGWRG